MKSIIIYYSKSGVTEKLANRIKDNLNCDLLKVEPKKAYGNYVSAVLRVAKEMISKKAVEFITPIPDLKDYDVIFIGYPIWYSKIPGFLGEFLKLCDTKNKKIIPFSTSGGSNIKITLKSLKNVISNDAEIIFPFNYGINKKDNFEEWISKIKELNK